MTRADSTSRPRQAGVVVASFGRRFEVALADGTAIECVTRGKRNDLACGDRVEVVAATAGDSVIESVQPRDSLFHRSDRTREKLIAANVTQIVIVVAPVPACHRDLIDRCLAAAEHAGIRPLIVINKVELPQSPLTLASLAIYAKLGYELIAISARTDLDALRARLASHTNVLVGQSGVGKSTIINGLRRTTEARVGDLSRGSDRGRHTTTHARLYQLDSSTRIIDSPGLQEFGLQHVGLEDIARCFVDFRPRLGRCRFSNCRHLVEPGCAIIEASDQGEIDPQRLASYRSLVAQLSARRGR